MGAVAMVEASKAMLAWSHRAPNGTPTRSAFGATIPRRLAGATLCAARTERRGSAEGTDSRSSSIKRLVGHGPVSSPCADKARSITSAFIVRWLLSPIVLRVGGTMASGITMAPFGAIPPSFVPACALASSLSDFKHRDVNFTIRPTSPFLCLTRKRGRPVRS